MKIRDILQKKGADVLTITSDRTVHEAIALLCEHRIGALVVQDDDEIVGIVSERDILRECGERCESLKQTKVAQIMTKDLIIGVLDDKLTYVMGVMTKNRVRHLPVMEGGELVGIISIGDVVNAHLKETEFENRLLKDYIHGVRP